MMSVKYLLSFFQENDMIRLVKDDKVEYMGLLGELPYRICKYIGDIGVVKCDVMIDERFNIPFLNIIYM